MLVEATSLIKIFVTLRLHRPKNTTCSNHTKHSSQQGETQRFQTCKQKIELHKKHHCVQTHNPRGGFRLRAKKKKEEKKESGEQLCSKWSQGG